ncbi:hypothetical protein B7P34_07605 [Streptosporangium nondiastaticum]|uniref:Circularly permuted ATPgrasp domain-containing protein n=1 Tax=Streptosporangium nondiastaticum TaxID=35764 RepID=A0A9X7JTF4_9ACTN|nr:hypothetical protein B7P34_07605 [Streptosporangium nondiastaticum]
MISVFAEDNRAFLAEQYDAGRSPERALAARAGNQLLADVGMKVPMLPCHFRIAAAEHAALERATRLLADAQDKVLAHLCATLTADELAAMFEVRPEMAAHVDWPSLPSSRLRMLRADIIPTDTGYWFCELNHFSGVGGGEAYHAAHLHAEVLGRPVTGISPFRQLALQYVTECRRAGLTRVVVLDTPGHRAQGYGQHLLLQQYIRHMAPGIELAYHDELTYPAEWLETGEARRTLVHRLVTFDDTTDNGAFLARLRACGATLSCMFEAELKMHRRWFALLCDQAHHHLLTAEERAAIEQYVPHTAVVGPADIDTVIADKDRLVFKRSYLYGGKGVLAGDQHTADELRDLLTRDDATWYAQRRVHASTIDLPSPDGTPVPYHLVLGMYLYGDRTSGVVVRGAADSPVVNGSRSAGMTWAFVV